MIDVSIGICSRNRAGTLEQVLLSLCDQTIGSDRFEVVLVDDGSEDDTAEMVRRVRPQINYELAYLWQPHGALATARNTGIRASRGQVMLYIDDDVLAHPRLLEEHMRVHRQFDRCVCNGWVNHVTEAVRPDQPKFTAADISTSFFWTSNVSVKLAHLKEAGCFDEDFKEYGWEDQELGLRLMAIGLKKRNNYKAIGFHIKKPPTQANVAGALAQARAKARSARIYIEKHPRLRSRFSTGAHPPRLALANLANLGGWWESYLRRQLPQGDSPERPLTAHQAYCLKELATVEYFRTLQGG
ncbi:MAG: glycosyltransferase [Vulcanimicrobiota bacterium]